METVKLKELIGKILSDNKYKVTGLHVSEIAKIIYNKNTGLFPEDSVGTIEQLKNKVNQILYADSRRKTGNEYSVVKNLKTNKAKKGYYKIKGVKSPKLIPPPKAPLEVKTQPVKIDHLPTDPNTLFIGKAGECAVISELLFRGFNANLMMVDDGVDIVASKNNLYYFIQVKTTVMNDNGKVYVSLKKDRYDIFINSQIRYIVVARCQMAGLDTNLYFVFNNNNIEQFMFDGVVKKTDSSISIKIRLDKENSYVPYLYHEKKEQNITFFMNNFNL